MNTEKVLEAYRRLLKHFFGDVIDTFDDVRQIEKHHLPYQTKFKSYEDFERWWNSLQNDVLKAINDNRIY